MSALAAEVMRTTLVIDDDVLRVAKQLAGREHKSVGEVVSALARRGLASATGVAQAERNGIPLLPTRKKSVPVTLEWVTRLLEASP